MAVKSQAALDAVNTRIDSLTDVLAQLAAGQAAIVAQLKAAPVAAPSPVTSEPVTTQVPAFSAPDQHIPTLSEQFDAREAANRKAAAATASKAALPAESAADDSAAYDFLPAANPAPAVPRNLNGNHAGGNSKPKTVTGQAPSDAGKRIVPQSLTSKNADVVTLWHQSAGTKVFTSADGETITLTPKQFKTDSLGWGFNGTVELKLAGEIVSASCGINLILHGTKPGSKGYKGTAKAAAPKGPEVATDAATAAPGEYVAPAAMAKAAADAPKAAGRVLSRKGVAPAIVGYNTRSELLMGLKLYHAGSLTVADFTQALTLTGFDAECIETLTDRSSSISAVKECVELL